MRFPFLSLLVLLSSGLVNPTLAQEEVEVETADHDDDMDRWTVDDLLSYGSNSGHAGLAFGIGHRGFGANPLDLDGDGYAETLDESKPKENTLESAALAFDSGMLMVEVDVVMTADQIPILYHDDFLLALNMTCLNTLTLQEVQEMYDPEITTLADVLQLAYNYSLKSVSTEEPRGLLELDIKPPSPLCDPDDLEEPVVAQAVIQDILDANMEHQVLFSSFSPALLAIAQTASPEVDIAMELCSFGLQFVNASTTTALTGIVPVPINKTNPDLSFGLQWYDAYPVFRLVNYKSIEEFVGVLLATGSRTACIDIPILFTAESTMPGSGSALVQQLESFGLTTVAYTAADENDWYFLEGLGIDLIITDNITMADTLQATWKQSNSTETEDIEKEDAAVATEDETAEQETDSKEDLEDANDISIVERSFDETAAKPWDP